MLKSIDKGINMRMFFRIQLSLVAVCMLGACTKTDPPATGASETKKPETLTSGKVTFLPTVPIPKSDPRVTGPSLLCNGSFEEWERDKVNCWTVNTEHPIKGTPATSLAAQGSQSLRLEMKPGAPTEVSQEIELKAMQRYLVRCMLIPQNFAGSALLKITGSGGGGAYELTQENPGKESGWTLLSLEADPPPFITKLKVSLVFVGSPVDTSRPGCVYIDDCSVLPMKSENPANLIRNGSFSEGANGLDFWDVDKALMASRDASGFVPDVPHCLKIQLLGNKNMGIKQTVSGLVTGQAYVCQGFVKAEDLTGKASIEIQHGTQGYKAFLKRTNEVTGTTGWTPVSVEFVAPADMQTVDIFLRRPAQQTDPGKPGSVWFAKCELFPVKPQP